MGAGSRAMAEFSPFTPVRNRLLLTLTVMLATVMQTLDMTIANVALPHMQGSFAATQDQMMWVLTSYIVAAAITTPLAGWLATRFDRKTIFLLSIAGFTLASVLCGMSMTLEQIVTCRLLQGMSGAALVPLSQAVLFDINPPKNHGRAMSFWGVGVTLGPILGPVLGGWLTEDYNWRWVFYINVPVGILAFLGLLLFMPSGRSRQSYRFDVFGFVALSVAVGSLQIMLDRGGLKDWFSSTEILIEAMLAVAALYFYIVHAAIATRSFINASLFADANFLVGAVFIFFMSMVMFATLALLPPLLQDILNYPVITTGLVTAPRGAGIMLAMFTVGRLVGRVGTRYLIGFGLVLTAVALRQMSHFSPLMDPWPVIETGALQGFGLGFITIPTATVSFTTLTTEIRTEGTAFFSLVRSLGGSVGISVAQALLTRNTQVLHAGLSLWVSPYNSAANLALRSTSINLSSPHDLAVLNDAITRQAGMIAYLDDFRLMMVVTLLLMPLLLLFRQSDAIAPQPSVGAD